MPGVAVVTDSTGVVAVPPSVAVVPTQVVIDGVGHLDGTPQSSSDSLLEALAAKQTVSTSRPSPAAFAETYARLAEAGYDQIVSVHLSGAASGTVESARLAARTSPIPVTVVDTRAVGPCLGFAVQAAARAVEAGADAAGAERAAMDRANHTRSYFYVDTLEFLRRGGRIGAAAALLGSALAVKPLLAIENGEVVPQGRVRTAMRALARLEELAVEAAGERAVEVMVAHLGADDRAAALVEALSERLATGLQGRGIRTGELGAVLGAHVGPGTIAVVVAPAL